jgi:hypothetical protein
MYIPKMQLIYLVEFGRKANNENTCAGFVKQKRRVENTIEVQSFF